LKNVGLEGPNSVWCLSQFAFEFGTRFEFGLFSRRLS
jgi:hypothetical protein